MPVSHEFKLIFIHIPKTGGSSIERVLGLQGVDNGGSTEPDRSILFGVRRRRFLRFQYYTVYQHLTAREVKGEVGADVFRDYFKFAFVRNPYDRALSDYRYLRRRLPEGLSLRDFLLNHVEPAVTRRIRRSRHDDHFFDQSRFVLDRTGKPLVDYIGRFESLAVGFSEVCSKAGIANLELPKVNPGREDATEHDDETRSIVYRLYRRDFDNFGYEK